FAYQIKDNQATKIKASQHFKRIIAVADGYMAIDTKELFHLDKDFNIKASWPRPNILNLLNINDSLFLSINRNYIELLTLRGQEMTIKGTLKSNFITEQILYAVLQGNELMLQAEETVYKFSLSKVRPYPILLEADQLKINKNIFTTQD